MLRFQSPEPFFQDHRKEMFYVGFLKSPEAWFPLCAIRDPGEDSRLDSLFVSFSYRDMSEALEAYAGKLSRVEETLVQYLFPEEISNLLERYGLEHLAVVARDEGADAGSCDCGCGCS